jgi:alpha-1,3-mannosyltransferase
MYDVVHLVRLYKPNVGGMELIVENIARVQIKQGLNVLILTSDHRAKNNLEEIIDNIKVLRLPSITIRGIIFPWFLFNKQKIETRCLHVHGMDPFVDFSQKIIRFNKKVLSPHGSFYHTHSLKLLKDIYWSLISKPRYSKVTSYCISKNDVAMMSNLTKKTELMGCGITTRNVYSEGQDSIIFGRISPNKRVQFSIDFAQRNFSENKIYVAGENQQKLDFSKYGNNLDYFGKIDDEDLSCLIRKSKYFICMSSYEGLGIALLEALYCGLRCCISSIESFNNIISDIPKDIRKKFIYVLGSSEAIDDWKNIQVSREDQKIMRDYILENYSWEKVVKNLKYGKKNGEYGGIT